MRLSIVSVATALLLAIGQNQASAQVVVRPVPDASNVTYYDPYYGYYTSYPVYSVPVYRYSVPPVVAYPSYDGYRVGYGTYYPSYTYSGWGSRYGGWGYGGYGWRGW